MNDHKQKFDAAMAFLASRVSSGRCIRDPLADLHEALAPFHTGVAHTGNAFDRMEARYASLDSAQSAPVAAVEPQADPPHAEDGLWRPVAGKYGRTRDGQKVGPIERGQDFFCGRVSEGEFFHYLPDGSNGNPLSGSELDLVSEWKDDKSAPLASQEAAE